MRSEQRESAGAHFELMRVAVVTVSDTVAKGQRDDASGPAVVAGCRGLGWEGWAIKERGMSWRWKSLRG